MAWKKRSTSKDMDFEVDLDDFDEEQLLQGLIDAKWISEGEAEAIKNRVDRSGSFYMAENADAFELDRARMYLQMGRKDDALHHIENYLGREWIGLLQ